MEDQRFLRLQRSTEKLPNGLYKLKLGLYRRGSDWGLIDEVWCVSGGADNQTFRPGAPAETGSMEPIPEGYYWCAKPEWRGSVGDWNASWGNGLGPVWIGLRKFDVKQTRRDNFGLHWDNNMSTAPGSAGCIVFQDRAQLEKCLSWFDDPRIRPEFVTVNWGFNTVDTGNGSISKLPAPKQDPVKPSKKEEEAKPLPPKPHEDGGAAPVPPAKSKAPLWIIAAVLLGGAALFAFLAVK